MYLLEKLQYKINWIVKQIQCLKAHDCECERSFNLKTSVTNNIQGDDNTTIVSENVKQISAYNSHLEFIDSPETTSGIQGHTVLKIKDELIELLSEQPNLQQVLEKGNEADKTIILDNIGEVTILRGGAVEMSTPFSGSGSNRAAVFPDEISVYNYTPSLYLTKTSLTKDGLKFKSLQNQFGTLSPELLTSGSGNDRVWQLPNKSGTIALLDDVVPNEFIMPEMLNNSIASLSAPDNKGKQILSSNTKSIFYSDGIDWLEIYTPKIYNLNNLVEAVLNHDYNIFIVSGSTASLLKLIPMNVYSNLKRYHPIIIKNITTEQILIQPVLSANIIDNSGDPVYIQPNSQITLMSLENQQDYIRISN